MQDLHLTLELDKKDLDKIKMSAAALDNEKHKDRILRALGKEAGNLMRRLQEDGLTPK